MRSSRLTLAGLLLGGIAAWLAAPPPLVAQQVSISLERFQKLWDQAHPLPPDPSPPTVPLAVESARIGIAVGAPGADTARLTTELTVVLDPAKPSDDLILALPGLGSLISVSALGCDAAIDSTTGAGEGPPFLRLRGTGRHSVTVESALPVPLDLNAVEAERHLEVTWPAAAWVTGALLADRGIQRIEATNGGAVAEDGPGRWLLVGDPGARLSLRLFGQPATPAPSADEPLAFDVDTASALALSRARRRVTSFLEIHIRGGRPETLENLRVPVPAGYEVLSATGDRVADWEVANGTLAIRLRRQTARDFSLQVQLAADPAEEIDSPVLVPAQARTVRAARKVAVRANDGLLEPIGSQPLDRLAVDQLGGFAAGFREAPGAPLHAEPGRPSPLWRVTWATGGEVLTGQIDRLVVDVLIGEAGTAHYQLWAQARNGEAALVLGLPAGARLLAARRDGVEITPGRLAPSVAGGGIDEWALPMVVREAAQVAYLEALIPEAFPPQGGRLTIPLPRLGIPASRIEVRVAAPPGFVYTFAEPGRAGRVMPPPGGLPGRSAQPIWLEFLDAPAGFSVLEANWSGWSKEPTPLLIDVKPLAVSRRDR